jgi:hypothetical protein
VQLNRGAEAAHKLIVLEVLWSWLRVSIMVKRYFQAGRYSTQYSSLTLISTSDLDTLSIAVNDERDDANLRKRRNHNFRFEI